ncbi:MAG: polyprenyl synthetase family protein [Saprospiraceae bacterium]|jgi:octaprenyl-diphosphate synthase|nr:polyprenyl synthetase family protein [Saprospiraceae bacterium]MBK7796276.1 polyprenyl synthetase family protein [Saprospiraceae bacterium]MBK8154534.1 polyprenyl synthetase family protein [Saprospiraceae bacterium]MBL0260332.1 polyprenyl synthetase family protein [Saprospiraceae bacterium]
MASLSEIKKPVLTEIALFDSHFRDAMKSRVALLDKITYYIVKTKGKQFRPLICILTAKMLGEVNDKTYAAATLVELLHTASLVHDDVVDNADQRRSFFSINALWKNKIAVLVGDYLLSRGLLTALSKKYFDLLEVLSVAVKEMSEGELLQLEKARRLDITEEIYYQIIRQKTASLIRVSCRCGAQSVTEDPAVIEHVSIFGEQLGLAFQIKDDLMDINADDTGKPKILDIKEKKMTLPLISALQAAPAGIRKEIISDIRSRSEDEAVIRKVLSFIHDYKGAQIAHQKMNQHRDIALQALEQLPANVARNSLSQLCYFVTERTS